MSTEVHDAAARLIHEVELHVCDGPCCTRTPNLATDIKTVAGYVLAQAEAGDRSAEAERLEEAIEALRGTGDVLLALDKWIDQIAYVPARENLHTMIALRLGASGALINAWRAALAATAGATEVASDG